MTFFKTLGDPSISEQVRSTTSRTYVPPGDDIDRGFPIPSPSLHRVVFEAEMSIKGVADQRARAGGDG